MGSYDVNPSGGNPVWSVNFSEGVVVLKAELPSGQNNGLEEKKEKCLILGSQETHFVFSLGTL